jgi:hypothetical protein
VYGGGDVRVHVKGSPSDTVNTNHAFVVLTNKRSHVRRAAAAQLRGRRADCYPARQMFTSVRLYSAPVKTWRNAKGLMMHWMDVRVIVPGRWNKEVVGGLCGWFDGNPKNDFRVRGMKGRPAIVHTSAKMAITWHARDAERLLDVRRKPLTTRE